jgi:homoserine O-acetyltransferase/O-succinyltransferase
MSVKVLRHEQAFPLDCGEVLPFVDIAYHTFGKLNMERSNVVWICHAFSANSDPSDWWPGMVGPGKYFNPEEHYVVCANMLGSCYGSSGPLTINPETGEPYFGDFPVVTVRDMVRSLMILRQHLGIEKVWFALGFSMGGQQMLEWLLHEPEVFEHVLLGATNIRHSPWGIAFNESQRMAIEADSTFGERTPEAGLRGMRAARSIGLISYRNYTAYCKTQEDESHDKLKDFKACSYQRYQGDKLVKRFNAYSYYRLSQAMDNHNILRGRSGNPADVLKTIQARTLVLGINSDYLFPIEEQELLAKHLPNNQFVVIDSDYGHDGFLIEFEKMSLLLDEFLK